MLPVKAWFANSEYRLRFYGGIFIILILAGLFGVSWLLPPVIAAPYAPSPILPAEGDAVIIPTFSWMPSAGAVKYRVQVGPQSDPLLVYWEDTTLNLNLTPVDGLPNEPLYWRVGAYLTGDTVPSSWSSKVNFTKYIPAPLLNSPANHIALTAPTFGWDPVLGAARYKVEVTLDPTFTSINATYTTYNSSLTPSNAADLPHGVYYWRVRGMDAATTGHEGDNSVVWTFVKHIPAPMVVGPSSGAQLVIPTFEWLPTENTAYYRVEISANEAFDPLLFTDTTYATRLTPRDSLPQGTFYWRVRGVDADGQEGSNSPAQFFTKNISPPELVSPAPGASITLPTLDWSPAAGAVSYQIELSVVASFNPVLATYTTFNNRLTPSQTLALGVYYWRVRGLDGNGNAGMVSTARSFTLAAPLAPTGGTPQLQTPSDGEILSIDPTFRWTPVVGAVSYYLRVSKNSAFSPIYESLSVHYTSYTPYTAGLKDAYVNGQYWWKVEARNSGGQVISTSPPRTFTKQTPLLLAGPADLETLLNEPTFQWTPIPGAKTYYLKVSKSATFDTTYDALSLDYPQYTPYTGLERTYANGTYYWRIEGRNTAGQVITTSQPRSFTRQSRVLLSDPDNNSVLLTDPTFSWEPVVGARNYYLKVSTDPAFGSTYDGLTVDYTSYTPFTAGLKDQFINGVYYWKVEARDISGSVIATSQAFMFTKGSTVLLTAPADGASMGGSPTFSWAPVVGAKNYYLRVSTSSTFGSSYDAVTTDYTSYTPYTPGLKNTYIDDTYYWRVEARNYAGTAITTSAAQSFTVISSQPTSTPIGAPSLTPTLTPSLLPPTEPPPGEELPPTPPAPYQTAEPPPTGGRTLGNVKVYADTFTDLGENRWNASGNVRLGSLTADYVVIGSGEVILDYNTLGIEGSSSSLVSLLLDDNTLATVFAGPFQVDSNTGELAAMLNTVFQLTRLGDLGVDSSTPLAQFAMNVIQGTVSAQAEITLYPIEDIWNSARVDFTLTHDGKISGGLGVGDLSFEAAGLTFAVESGTLSYDPATGGKVTIGHASISLPEAFDLGGEGSVDNLVITANGLESVSGGSIKLELPDMAVPGTEGKLELAGASVTLSLAAGGDYYINGRADFSMPNISSKGNPNTTYSGSFYAEFQLDQDGLDYVLLGGEIDPGIPIGQSGFVMTKLEGRVDLRPLVRVQITGTLQTSVEVPPLGPLISGEPTIWVQLEEPYELGIGGSVKVLIFDAAEASLVLSQNSGLTGAVHINYFPYAMEGDATLHVWRSGGEFHFTGSAIVTLGFHQGALGSYWGIDLPPTNLTFAELSTEFGEFCNDRYCYSTVYGFKGAVDLTIDAVCPRFGIPPWYDCSFNLFSYAFFIDVEGHLDYGSSLDQYRLVDQAAYLAQASSPGWDAAGNLATTNSLTFTVGNTDLTLVGMDWVSGTPALSLIDPHGTAIYTDTVGYAGLGYTQTPQSFAYLLQNPVAGTWTAVISNLSGGEAYTFRALGRNLPPALTLSGVAARPAGRTPLQPQAVTLQWNAFDVDEETNLALFYDTDGSGADGVLIADGLDPAAGSYTWDPSLVKSGTYHVYASVDDLKNLRVTRYFSETVAVVNTAPPATPVGVVAQASAGGRNFQVCWNLNTEPDVVGYQVYLGSQSGIYDLGVFEATNLGCYTLTVPYWLQEVYIAVSAYDNSGNYSPLSTELHRLVYRERVYLPLLER